MKEAIYINFKERTYAQLCVSYEKLRTRYKQSVRLITDPVGAGLLVGYFQIG